MRSTSDGLHPRRRRDVLDHRSSPIGKQLQVSQRAHLLPAPGWDSCVRLAHLRRAPDERHEHRSQSIDWHTHGIAHFGKVGQRTRRTSAALGAPRPRRVRRERRNLGDTHCLRYWSRLRLLSQKAYLLFAFNRRRCCFGRGLRRLKTGCVETGGPAAAAHRPQAPVRRGAAAAGPRLALRYWERES